MRVGSLFSGGGLGDFGFLMAGCKIVFQVEIDPYCQKILELRYPDAKKFRDIRAVKGSGLPGCDIITGGFPCQDLSYAGKGAGITGERSGLWKEYLRLICEIRPRYVVVENVPGLLSRGMGVVLGDLASIGYDAEWECVSAEAVGAPHKRDRVWIVGYPKHAGFDAAKIAGSIETRNDDCASREKQAGEPTGSNKQYEELADSNNKRVERCTDAGIFSVSGKESIKQSRRQNAGAGGVWAVEPVVGRLANGVANRVERIKLLGNGQVPYCTKWIAERIMEYEGLTVPTGQEKEVV